MSRLAQLADLVRMDRAAEATALELEHVLRQIRRRAERLAIGDVGGKTYCFGRGSTSWRPTHERAFAARVAELEQLRGRELEALRRKHARQVEAIAARRRKLGVNARPRELADLVHDLTHERTAA